MSSTTHCSTSSVKMLVARSDCSQKRVIVAIDVLRLRGIRRTHSSHSRFMGLGATPRNCAQAPNGVIVRNLTSDADVHGIRRLGSAGTANPIPPHEIHCA